MKLRDRLGLGNNSAPAAMPTQPARAAAPAQRWAPLDRAYQDLKLRIHRELLDRIDLDNLGRLDLESASAELRGVIAQLIEEQASHLTDEQRQAIFRDNTAGLFNLPAGQQSWRMEDAAAVA